MNNKLHCPYCGGVLKIASHDEDMMEVYEDAQGLTFFTSMVYGRCNNCNRRFNWMADYELKLVKVMNFEGVD